MTEKENVSETVTMPRMRPVEVAEREGSEAPVGQAVFDIRGLTVRYGSNIAVKDVDVQVYEKLITAVIGPSGCGKSTFIRCLNRMNDTVRGFNLDGKLLYHGADLYGDDVEPIEVRRRIGMVFQKPNPFPKTIYDNVAWAPRILGMKQDLDQRVERALNAAALWDEVKDRLHLSGLGLSGGQQQRLCIARAIAVEPEIILMDEPCAALDPIATAKVEELIQDLRTRYTIVIVTHNMQQAARASDHTAFFYLGKLVEYGATRDLFMNPANRQTEDYVSGRFG